MTHPTFVKVSSRSINNRGSSSTTSILFPFNGRPCLLALPGRRSAERLDFVCLSLSGLISCERGTLISQRHAFGAIVYDNVSAVGLDALLNKSCAKPLLRGCSYGGTITLLPFQKQVGVIIGSGALDRPVNGNVTRGTDNEPYFRAFVPNSCNTIERWSATCGSSTTDGPAYEIRSSDPIQELFADQGQ